MFSQIRFLKFECSLNIKWVLFLKFWCSHEKLVPKLFDSDVMDYEYWRRALNVDKKDEIGVRSDDDIKEGSMK